MSAVHTIRGVILAAILTVVSWGVVGAQTTENLLLLYDEARFSIVNVSEEEVSLLGLAFVSGNPPDAVSRFEAYSWTNETTSLGPGECVQLVFGLERGPARPSACNRLLSWRATRQIDFAFWLVGLGEDGSFRVFQGSRLLAECESGVGSCPVDALPDPPTVLVGNLMLYYTPETLVIFNDAANTEPPLKGLVIVPSGGEPLDLSDVEWETILLSWNSETLASGQCLMIYQGDTPSGEPAMRCEVVAHAGLETAFWRSRFEVVGSVLGRTGLCAAARADVASLCVVSQ